MVIGRCAASSVLDADADDDDSCLLIPATAASQ